MTLGGLLINRRTRRCYRLDGCRRSHFKPLLDLTKPFISHFTRQQLPDFIDLRTFFSPIEAQHTLGSCVGNALAASYEYFYLRSTGNLKYFSRLFIYYNARLMEDEIEHGNTTESDSGADLQFAIAGLVKYGCCDEQLWPYDDSLVNIQPTETAYKDGKQYCVEEFWRLSNDLTDLRECLAQGYPFVIAIKIFSSFASNHHGYIPMPKINEKSSQYRHAVVCVGYDHTRKFFIIRNSHGREWGDGGYGYLPYKYVTNKELTKELWAIKTVSNMNNIPIDPGVAWKNSPPLLLAETRPWEMSDDRSKCDILYSSDDDDDDDDDDDREQHDSTLFENYHGSSSSHDQQDYFVQTPFAGHFSPVGVQQPIMTMQAPWWGPIPYHPSMFGPTPFSSPFFGPLN